MMTEWKIWKRLIVPHKRRMSCLNPSCCNEKDRLINASVVRVNHDYFHPDLQMIHLTFLSLSLSPSSEREQAHSRGWIWWMPPPTDESQLCSSKKWTRRTTRQLHEKISCLQMSQLTGYRERKKWHKYSTTSEKEWKWRSGNSWLREWGSSCISREIDGEYSSDFLADDDFVHKLTY